MPESAVLGVGMTPFVRRSDLEAPVLGRTALVQALVDAAVDWPDIELVVVGAVGLGVSAAGQLVAQMQRTGVDAVAVENASATGSAAFALAQDAVASGRVGLAAAVGIGSLEAALTATQQVPRLDLRTVTGAMLPPVLFALRAARRFHLYGETIEDHARVVVKNLRNASQNDLAQRRTPKSLEEVLASPMLAEPILRDACCPLGNGAAAVVVGPMGARPGAVRVLASITGSDHWHPAGGSHPDPSATARVASAALARAGIGPEDLDVVEVHDAFAVEELDYCEAIGLCGAGEAANALAAGTFDVGGTVAVSPSGGLLARGHPGGATGLAQVVEVTTQLRGRAGHRQQPGARTGMAHMIGAGGICTVHVLGGD
ncbi:MAG: thiolase family protein [Acidimicrobiales bacterium]